MDHEYWTYIVASRSGTLYIGMTNNLYRRVMQHKAGEIEGFSQQYKCNRLVYHEGFDDATRAIDREKQWKGMAPREEDCIESMNPRWQDLAEKWGCEMAFAGVSIKDR